MKYIIHFFLGLFVLFASYTAFDIYTSSKELNSYKYDYAEIHQIKYGLFNVDLWKEKLFYMLEDRVSDFDITAEDLSAIRKQIIFYLEDLYKEYFESGKLIDALVEAQTEDDDSQKLGKFFVGLFRNNIEKEIQKMDFKAQIPLIADNLMVEVERKTPEIKESIAKSISDMLAEELASRMEDPRVQIYNKYDTKDFDSAKEEIKVQMDFCESNIDKLILRSLIALIACLILLLVFYKVFDIRSSMSWMTAVCTVFLILGLALPMIDLDARLSTLDITILGEDIHFDEQVMYFQSKSIIDVTRTLLEGNGLDLKIVGLLILVFSIVLPFSKMLLGTVYLYLPKTRDNSIIKTIIFYMGKWSMADVFVVAIFMSYIGFYGLISSMLGDLSSEAHSTVAETVNYSKLSPGIIFFTAYCILSIMMSSIMHRKFRSE